MASRSRHSPRLLRLLLARDGGAPAGFGAVLAVVGYDFPALLQRQFGCPRSQGLRYFVIFTLVGDVGAEAAAAHLQVGVFGELPEVAPGLGLALGEYELYGALERNAERVLPLGNEAYFLQCDT